MLMERERVWVKICGILDLSTALAAAEAGADALGFVFAPSRRRIDSNQAAKIIKELPPHLEKVGVFVNPAPGEAAEIAGKCGLTAIQLCGNEPPEFSLPYPIKIIRAIQVKGNSISRLPLNAYQADAFLFDSFKAGVYGGTGEVFDWDLVKGIKFPKPVILAGGLNEANVEEAIKKVRPYGVDVSSGVETGGYKDPEKIRRFVQKAKGIT